MKKLNFKVGDKVFAKIKGYPPWPARIIAENGKKYNVEFYGTGEMGVIKVEDLFYYLKHKEKFQRPLKRKDYLDAFEQIQKAIEEDGGDGDDTPTDEASNASKNNVSLNSTTNSVDTPAKGGRKNVKRKRSGSAADKTATEESPVPSKRSTGRSAKSEDKPEDPKPEKKADSPVKPSSPKKSPRAKADNSDKSETQERKEFEFVPLEQDNKEQKTDKTEATEKEDVAEKAEALDFKVEIVSEKFLKNNIAYAKHVKESESCYKERSAEPREDHINHVLPVKLSSGVMGGIKLHKGWPLKFDNEYERALYDESVAQGVLDYQLKVASGDQSIINNHQLFIANIEMTPDDVKQSLYLKDIELKKARIDRLKVESEFVALDMKIKNCLGLDKADPKEALQHLEAMLDIEFDDIMLKKHSHIVEMVRRLRKYVGNTKEWKMTEDSLQEFSSWAEKVRAKAEIVYSKFKSVTKLPENCTSFWDGFTDLVSKFRADCKDMTESQIYILCAEPRSRKAFLDHLDELESEKENSSGVANAEVDSANVNGTAETPAT